MDFIPEPPSRQAAYRRVSEWDTSVLAEAQHNKAIEHKAALYPIAQHRCSMNSATVVPFTGGQRSARFSSWAPLWRPRCSFCITGTTSEIDGEIEKKD